MTYRNKKSGELIVTTNKISGKNWEPVEDTTQENAVVDSADEIPAEETADEIPAEETADEIPAEETANETPVEDVSGEGSEKPKRQRRGKK